MELTIGDTKYIYAYFAICYVTLKKDRYDRNDSLEKQSLHSSNV